MFNRIIKDIFLSFKRTPTGSVINILGMSVGIAIFLLIMMYVRSEIRVNRSFPDYSEMYRLSRGDGTGWQGVPGHLGEILVEEVPEIASFLRIDHARGNYIVKINNEPQSLGRVLYADSTLLKFFPMKIKYGDKSTCLNDPMDIVLTESLSRKLFGEENPVGKDFIFNNNNFARITAVVEDPGPETHIEADAFLSFHSMPVLRKNPELFNCWTCYNYQCYLLLHKDLDLSSVIEKINQHFNDYGKQHNIESLQNDTYTLTNMYDVYFGKEERPEFRKGNLSQLRMLEAIGLLILIMALINYVNLATAQSGSRIRELAIRKALGATRGILIRSIIFEAVFVGLVSLNIGLVLLEIIKPLFNSILGLQLSIGYMKNPLIFVEFIGGGLLLGLIAGIYPALYITRFDASRSLQKIIVKSGSGSGVRKVLTVVQLLMSIALIICSGIIFSQLKYTQKLDLGFDKEILIYTPLNSDLSPKCEIFRQELLAYNGIENVSFSYGSYRVTSERWGLDYLGKNISLHIEAVDEHYFNTLGLNILEGRNFYGPQDEEKVIINETAKREYFGDNPVGIFIESMDDRAEIVGVVQDFSFRSLHSPIEPIAIIYRERWRNMCNIRMKGDDVRGVISHLEKTWKTFSPNFPFEFHFVDDLYQQKYFKEQMMGKLAVFFSIVSVLIAFLGIFGLITFAVEKRSKEVGIRKVNGASIGEIVWLFSKNISNTVLWAIVPAFAVSGYVMTRWLSGFANHISMPLWIFPLAVIMVWIITLLATIGKSIKTARINPAIVLRSI